MTRGIYVALLGLCGALLAAEPAPAQQPNFGCLANNNCGHKGGTTNSGPRDYWQNWICAGCHSGMPGTYVQSPPERALIGIPSRFWDMHADAVRDGETAVRAGSHRLLPTSRLTLEFQRLMQERPRGR